MKDAKILIDALEKIANGNYFPELPTSAMIANTMSFEARAAINAYNQTDKDEPEASEPEMILNTSNPATLFTPNKSKNE